MKSVLVLIGVLVLFASLFIDLKIFTQPTEKNFKEKQQTSISHMQKEEGLPKEAQSLKVTNIEGKEVPFPSIFKDRTVILTFLRHFGWYFFF